MSEVIKYNLFILQMRKVGPRKLKSFRETALCFSLKTQGEELFAPLSKGLILCPRVVFENVFHDSRYSRQALPQFGCLFFSEVTRVGTF